MISGDVPIKFPTLGFGVHVRKILWLSFLYEVKYINGTGKGLSWLASENFSKNPAWKGYYYAPTRTEVARSSTPTGIPSAPNGNGGNVVYYNYKAHVQDLSIQGIVTLNNIRFHKQKPIRNLRRWWFGSATIYETKVNALKADGSTYTAEFQDIFDKYGTVYKSRKDVRKALKSANG